MGASIKILETQIGQLAMAVKEQPTRSSSNDVENNVRECKAITVQSGIEVQAIMERECETKALKKSQGGNTRRESRERASEGYARNYNVP